MKTRQTNRIPFLCVHLIDMATYPKKQARRLRIITWLMLASQLMLLLFVGEWNRVQYKEEKRRLLQDVTTVFNTVETRLTDSLLNFTVANVLQTTENAPDSTHINIHFGHSIPGDSLQPHDSVIQFSATPEQPLSFMPGRQKGIVINQMNVNGKATTQQLPEGIKKILRYAFIQVAGESDMIVRSIVSDTILKTVFTQDLHQKWPGLRVTWNNDIPGDYAFTFRQKNNTNAVGIAVTGKGTYLFQNMLPQLLFSVILLLLTGLAFWLAYQTLRRQAIFGAQKDSFIDNISHELKTPVATTKVALEALSAYQGIDDPVRSRKYLQMATWEINRLETIIERVMQTLQTETGAVQLHKEPVNLYLLVNEITDMLQPVLTAGDVTTVWERADMDLTVPADKAHLLNTIYNLVDNAAKYGGHHITFNLQATNGKALLSITDNGPGIDAEYREKVFEKFFRIPQGNTHTVKGHGLGLSYARYIVEAHGGTMLLDGATAKGTSFIISLPITDPVYAR